MAEVTNTPGGAPQTTCSKGPDADQPLATEPGKTALPPLTQRTWGLPVWDSNVPGGDPNIQIAPWGKGARVFSMPGPPLEPPPLVATPGNPAYPFMTIKVVAGIYWEALRLFLKGVSLHAHPSEHTNVTVDSTR
ncbi:MAG: hypothetical protein CM15mP103_00830 [Gammaproteobacteria bacterium]|nr:MAG: hypothetical protein CM15mP103_00830 [Gammaproteobacteria bacterium]